MAGWQSSPFAGATIDFSAIGDLANDYYSAKDNALKRQATQESLAASRAARGRASSEDAALKAALADESIYDADGNFNAQAAASRLMRAGHPEAAAKVAQTAASLRKTDGLPTSAQEFEYYSKLPPEQQAQWKELNVRGALGGGSGGQFGKTGAVVQGADGQFYTVQFGADGTKKVEPLAFSGGPSAGGDDAPPQVIPLSPARGVEVVGDTAIDKATGRPVRNVGDAIRGGANAKEAGTISEIFDPVTGRPQKIQRQPDGSWLPVGGTQSAGVGELDRGTSTELYDKGSGQTVRTVTKDVAGAAAEQVRGKNQAEGEASLPKAANALAELEIKNKNLLGDPGTPGDKNKPATPGTIDRAIGKSSAWTTGLIGSQLAKVPGTAAHDLSNTLLEIQANLGFDTLQQMRDNSPTGGALGNVTERELALLQSTWASVQQSQSREQLVFNLNRIKQIKQRFAVLKRQAYEADVKRFGAAAVPNPTTGQAVNPASPPPAGAGGWSIQRVD